MRALVRCDASAAIGSGHLSRCLTLARALRAEGFTVDVATRKASQHTLDWIAGADCRAIPLDGEADDAVATRAAADGAALVVIDGYGFDPVFQETLRRGDRVVCVVDDLAMQPVRGDALLNGNLYAESLSYDLPEDTVALLGPAYALVRAEFILAREKRAVRAAAPSRRLLITMGGADPTAETEKAIAALHPLSAAAGELDVTIVVGGANPRGDAIRTAAAAAARPGCRVEIVIDARNMGALMAWCDVALTAAGGTCLELACVGAPAVVVVVADNQRGVAEALTSRGLMDVLGHSADVHPTTIADAIARLLGDTARARAMELAQRACIDGRGKDRAASRLAQLVRNRER